MDLYLLTQLEDQDESGRKGFFELLEHAERLERGYGQYFKPYSGHQMFFEYGTRPALDFDLNKYHVYSTVNPLDKGQAGKVQQIKSADDVIGCRYDILNEDDQVVVRGKDVGKLRQVPSYPMRMMDLIVEYTADFALSRIPALAESGRGFNEILKQYLDEEFLKRLNESELVSKNREAEEFYNEVYHFIEHLLSDVREFMGRNKWMVHLVSRSGLDLVVDSYVDYRVYKYTLDALEKQRRGE